MNTLRKVREDNAPIPWGGAPLWSHRVGAGSLVSDAGCCAAVDSQGGLLVTGRYRGWLDLADLGGSVLRGGPLTGEGFAIKLGPTGSLRWAARVVGTDNDRPAVSAVADSSGAWFLAAGAGSILWITKVDAYGKTLWYHRLSGVVSITTDRKAFGVATDAEGNVVITGVGAHTASAGSNDVFRYVFAIKLAPNGRLHYCRRYPCTGRVRRPQVAVDAKGHMLFWGFFNGMLQFGGSVLQSTALGLDLYLAKLDADGALLWQRRVPSRQTAGLAIAAAPRGEVYLCNTHRAGVDPIAAASPDEARPSLVLTKLDGDGDTAFARRYAVDKPLGLEPSLAVDGQGAVLLASPVRGTIDFEGGALLRGEQEGASLFVAKLDGKQGDHRWSRRFRGERELLGVSVHGAENGSARLVGFFSGSLDLGVGHLLRGAPGNPDLFVAKVAA